MANNVKQGDQRLRKIIKISSARPLKRTFTMIAQLRPQATQGDKCSVKSSGEDSTKMISYIS